MIYISQLVLKWWCLLLLVLFYNIIVVPPLVRADRVGTICNVEGCNCTYQGPNWEAVNCTLNKAQELKFDAHFIPSTIIEVFIQGGYSLTFKSKTFNQLALQILLIDGTQRIFFENQSFYNNTSASLLIQIQNCDRLIFKTGAFTNVDTTTYKISQCRDVTIKKSAFERLSNATFKDIPKITLSSRAFEFGSRIGRHGPVPVILFDNVIIPQIPSETFFTSLAQLNFKNAIIDEISNEAIKVNTILALSFINSTIKTIKNGAFTSKTVIGDFKISSSCKINTLETGAIMAGFQNFTVEHSIITEIQSGAINTTIGRVEIIENTISTLQSNCFVINDWNRISFINNTIKTLKTSFLSGQPAKEIEKFTFNENTVEHIEKAAFNIVPNIDDKYFYFNDNNFLGQTCHCLFDDWIIGLINVNDTNKIRKIINNTFCVVNEILINCFNLTNGLMNIKNFTKLVCKSEINCETYYGQTKIVNITNKIPIETQTDNTFWLTVIIASTSIVVLLMISSFLILLISKGGRWLKKRGYFRKIQYNNQNEQNNEEENTIVTIDENESENGKLEIPDELTIEYLQELSKKLDDPNTHQEASEMIEKLYEMFIIDDSYENNNRQDEEAHLYEELGNLQTQTTTTTTTIEQPQSDQTRNILRLMEEKISLQYDNSEIIRPKLAGVYSEPSDAAIHLYSELKQNKDDKTDDDDGDNNNTMKSVTSSNNMAFRPLPDKPGPSSKL